MVIVTKIARQVEGEYIMINVLGAFNKIENARQFLQNERQNFTEVVDNIPFVVELGIIENVEILDPEE